MLSYGGSNPPTATVCTSDQPCLHVALIVHAQFDWYDVGNVYDKGSLDRCFCIFLEIGPTAQAE